MPEITSAKPWEPGDAEREAKFDEKAQRWREKPNIAFCEHQDWHLDGANYQRQLWCTSWTMWINPSGFSCARCKKKVWPEIARWRAHVLPAQIEKKGREAAAEALVAAVERGRLSEVEA